MQMEKASSAEDLLQMCLKALEGKGGEADVRERLGLPAQDDGNNGKKKDAGAVQKALLQVTITPVQLMLACLARAAACWHVPFTDLSLPCVGRLLSCDSHCTDTWAQLAPSLEATQSILVAGVSCGDRMLAG